MLAGVVILLSNINVLNFGETLEKWWPVFIIGAGLLIILNNVKRYGWGLFVTLVGVFFLLNSLDIVQISVGDVFIPAILVAIGLSLLLKPGRTDVSRSDKSEEEITAILGGGSHKNTTNDYRNGKVTAVMGGAEIDLSKATIKKEAVIDVFVLMGGVELRVPDNVIVKSRATMVLGGVEDKTRPAESKNAPVLYLDGTVVMGGVEVKR